MALNEENNIYDYQAQEWITIKMQGVQCIDVNGKWICEKCGDPMDTSGPGAWYHPAFQGKVICRNN